MRKVVLLVVLEACVMSGWEFVEFPAGPVWRVLAIFGLATACAVILYLPEIKAWFDPVERIAQKMNAYHRERTEGEWRRHIRGVLDRSEYGIEWWNGEPFPRSEPPRSLIWRIREKWRQVIKLLRRSRLSS